jgi:hypothetical protein
MVIEELHRELEGARSNFKALDASNLRPPSTLSHSRVDVVSCAVQTGGDAGHIRAGGDVESLLMRVECLEKDNAKLEGVIRCGFSTQDWLVWHEIETLFQTRM